MPNGAIRLCVPYAMSDTDIAYDAIRLRMHYAIPVLTQHMFLCSSYAMSGPDVAYGATRCPCLWYNLHPIALRSSYAMSGTDLGYAATRSTGTAGRKSRIARHRCSSFGCNATDFGCNAANFGCNAAFLEAMLPFLEGLPFSVLVERMALRGVRY
eukprot:2086405-Rhodomonas_salina.2